MARVVLFHSMLGFRKVELGAAKLQRAGGHQVMTPDLYLGETAATLEEVRSCPVRSSSQAVGFADCPDDVEDSRGDEVRLSVGNHVAAVLGDHEAPRG